MALVRLAALAIIVLKTITNAEVTILSGVQTLYDRGPKLRVKATGLIGDEHDIALVIVSYYQKIYSI
jgi:hypothetical protein